MKANQFLTALFVGIFSTGISFGQEQSVATSAAETVVNTVPNYNFNYNLFFALTLIGFFLLIGILVVARSIRSLLVSDVYKNKLMGKSNESTSAKVITGLVVVGGLFASTNSFALGLKPKETKLDMPWLQVENSDIYLMFGLIAVLLYVLFYLKRMLSQILKDVGLAQEIEKTKKATSKLNAILTDAVPIEKEDSIMMEDEYDGIHELDNNLPPWWVAMLWATIIFAVVYVFHYHIFKTGDLQLAEYTKEIEKADVEVKEYLSKMAMNVDETNATVMTDAKDLDAGKTIFVNNCAVCHKENGSGDIGPNLTDDYWLYKGDIKDIYASIKNGRPNGMPEHASKLNPIQIQQVASFVYNFPAASGKEPQGEKYSE